LHSYYLIPSHFFLFLFSPIEFLPSSHLKFIESQRKRLRSSVSEDADKHIDNSIEDLLESKDPPAKKIRLHTHLTSEEITSDLIKASLVNETSKLSHKLTSKSTKKRILHNNNTASLSTSPKAINATTKHIITSIPIKDNRSTYPPTFKAQLPPNPVPQPYYSLPESLRERLYSHDPFQRQVGMSSVYLMENTVRNYLEKTLPYPSHANNQYSSPNQHSQHPTSQHQYSNQYHTTRQTPHTPHNQTPFVPPPGPRIPYVVSNSSLSNLPSPPLTPNDSRQNQTNSIKSSTTSPILSSSSYDIEASQSQSHNPSQSEAQSPSQSITSPIKSKLPLIDVIPLDIDSAKIDDLSMEDPSQINHQQIDSNEESLPKADEKPIDLYDSDVKNPEPSVMSVFDINTAPETPSKQIHVESSSDGDQASQIPSQSQSQLAQFQTPHSITQSNSQSQSQSNIHLNTESATQYQAVSLHTQSHSHPHTPSHNQSHSHPPTPSHNQSHSHPHTPSHIQNHPQTQSHTQSHTLSPQAKSQFHSHSYQSHNLSPSSQIQSQSEIHTPPKERQVSEPFHIHENRHSFMLTSTPSRPISLPINHEVSTPKSLTHIHSHPQYVSPHNELVPIIHSYPNPIQAASTYYVQPVHQPAPQYGDPYLHLQYHHQLQSAPLTPQHQAQTLYQQQQHYPVNVMSHSPYQLHTQVQPVHSQAPQYQAQYLQQMQYYSSVSPSPMQVPSLQLPPNHGQYIKKRQ
jgi:hypothetical protein